MELESQLVINPHHKSLPIKPDHLSIVWIKFLTPSSSFRPSLRCPTLELAQISWISPLSASFIFLDLALVIGLIRTCNGSLNACWFSSHSAQIESGLLDSHDQCTPLCMIWMICCIHETLNKTKSHTSILWFCPILF